MASETFRIFSLLARVHFLNFTARFRDLHGRALLLPITLCAFVVGYLVVGYLIFDFGLRYLSGFAVVGPLLTQRIIYLIFAFFFLMLIFSNLVIGYTALFKNRETNWFLSLPIRYRDIYRWKFLESLVVSSWALIFLSAPMMAAFGRVQQANAWFYLNTLLLYFPYVILPAVLGSWGILLLVRLLGKPWFKRALIAVFIVALVAIAFGVRPSTDVEAEAVQEVVSFDRLLKHTRLSLHPLLPSAWMASAILSWSEGLGRSGLFHALLLTSYALMALLLTFELAGRAFYSSWAHAFSGRSAMFQRKKEAKKRVALRVSLWERSLMAFPLGSPSWKALLIKDGRVFWRDPSQWTQFTIFFGLLVIYVLNLRNISYTFDSPFWTSMISFLNLCACAMTLSTLTTRFVFPQFSLEGRRIWILGLIPHGLPRVLKQKFLLSYFTTGGLTILLMTASSLMLSLPWERVLVFSLAIALMSGALSGLATAMGALFPDFREENPSKIVSGFGGTFCLVLSFLYVVVFIALAAFPVTLPFNDNPMPDSQIRWIQIACWATAALLSLGMMAVPMSFALRKVKNLEI